jgi:hypothetical protein
MLSSPVIWGGVGVRRLVTKPLADGGVMSQTVNLTHDPSARFAGSSPLRVP